MTVATNRSIPTSLIVDEKTTKINPSNYESVKEFLAAVRLKKDMDIDIKKENFVFSIPTPGGSNGSVMFMKIKQNQLDNDGFRNEAGKNQAIEHIFQAYLSGTIFRTSGSTGTGSRVYTNEDISHPYTNEINSIFWVGQSSNALLKELESRKQNTKASQELLAYLYDLQGDYIKADNAREKLCTVFSETCKKNMPSIIRWTVKDASGNPIVGAQITLLNDTNKYVITDEKGTYEIGFDTYPFSHIRIKAQADGHVDGIFTDSVNLYSQAHAFFAIHDFVLEKPEVNKEINETEVGNDGYFTVKSSRTTYRIPKNGLFYEDGRRFTGKIFFASLYEFTKQSKLDDLITVDTFTPVYGYVGSLMKTFGMPYIQLFDSNKRELFIKSSNPMTITNRIYHMKELYENSDHIYEALRKEDMTFLVQKTKELGWYPITYDFLVANHMLRWPAWWCLDRKRGTWDSVGIKVLSEEGDVELPFYSIRD